MFIFQPCLDFICQYVFCLFVIPCYLAFNFLKQVLILKILYTCTSLLILPIWIYGECSHVCTHIYTYAYSHCSLAEVCLVYRQWEKKHILYIREVIYSGTFPRTFWLVLLALMVYIFVHIFKQHGYASAAFLLKPDLKECNFECVLVRFWCLSSTLFLRESQNHRIIRVGRALWRWSGVQSLCQV